MFAEKGADHSATLAAPTNEELWPVESGTRSMTECRAEDATAGVLLLEGPGADDVERGSVEVDDASRM